MDGSEDQLFDGLADLAGGQDTQLAQPDSVPPESEMQEEEAEEEEEEEQDAAEPVEEEDDLPDMAVVDVDQPMDGDDTGVLHDDDDEVQEEDSAEREREQEENMRLLEQAEDEEEDFPPPGQLSATPRGQSEFHEQGTHSAEREKNDDLSDAELELALEQAAASDGDGDHDDNDARLSGTPPPSELPPKPLTAFFLFLKEKRAASPGTKTNELSAQWRSLSDEQKQEYSDKSAAMKKAYQHAVDKGWIKPQQKSDKGASGKRKSREGTTFKSTLKRPMSAYFLFCNKYRDEVKQELMNAAAASSGKAEAEIQEEDDDKDAAEEEEDHPEASSGEPARKKAKGVVSPKKSKDAEKKKPKTISVATVAKALSVRWKSLSEEAKKEFTDLGEELKQQYQEKLIEERAQFEEQQEVMRMLAPTQEENDGEEATEEDKDKTRTAGDITGVLADEIPHYLRSFPTSGEPSDLPLPLARVKKIMALDDECGHISKDASVLAVKATEAFLWYFASEARTAAGLRKRKGIQPEDVYRCMLRPNLRFLRTTIIPEEEEPKSTLQLQIEKQQAKERLKMDMKQQRAESSSGGKRKSPAVKDGHRGRKALNPDDALRRKHDQREEKLEQQGIGKLTSFFSAAPAEAHSPNADANSKSTRATLSRQREEEEQHEQQEVEEESALEPMVTTSAAVKPNTAKLDQFALGVAEPHDSNTPKKKKTVSFDDDDDNYALSPL